MEAMDGATDGAHPRRLPIQKTRRPHLLQLENGQETPSNQTLLEERGMFGRLKRIAATATARFRFLDFGAIRNR